MTFFVLYMGMIGQDTGLDKMGVKGIYENIKTINILFLAFQMRNWIKK